MRGFFAGSMVISIVLATIRSAQNDALPSDQPGKVGDHSLSLTLTQASEPSDSSPRKLCLADHPPLACVLLTITLKNSGSKPIVIDWSEGCGDNGLSFDMEISDGSWKPFPRDYYQLIVCTRNTFGIKRLSPGDSYEEHVRLGNANLGLDASYPPLDDDSIQARHPSCAGYQFLTTPGPRIIRARWSIRGCLATYKPKPDTMRNPFSSSEYCAQGTVPKPGLLLLESNELSLSPPR